MGLFQQNLNYTTRTYRMSQNLMPLCPAVTITFALSESLQVSTKEHSTESTSKTNKYCIIHVTSPIVSIYQAIHHCPSCATIVHTWLRRKKLNLILGQENIVQKCRITTTDFNLRLHAIIVMILS